MSLGPAEKIARQARVHQGKGTSSKKFYDLFRLSGREKPTHTTHNTQIRPQGTPGQAHMRGLSSTRECTGHTVVTTGAPRLTARMHTQHSRCMQSAQRASRNGNRTGVVSVTGFARLHCTHTFVCCALVCRAALCVCEVYQTQRTSNVEDASRTEECNVPRWRVRHLPMQQCYVLAMQTIAW